MWMSCQAPFRIRGEVARLLELPESRVRVIAPDVGGGFGVKTGPYREDVLLAWLARQLGRPVKWVATRREDQVTTNQARGSVCEGELALDADGRITGLRARIISPLGAHAHERGRGLAVEPRALPARRLRGPELRHHGQRRAHHHRAGLGLSRRRPAGGVLRHRAADGHRGAARSGSTRRRSGGAT